MKLKKAAAAGLAALVVLSSVVSPCWAGAAIVGPRPISGANTPAPLPPAAIPLVHADSLLPQLEQLQADPIEALTSLMNSGEPADAALRDVLLHPEAIASQEQELTKLIGPQNFSALVQVAGQLKGLSSQDEAVRKLLSTSVDPAAVVENFKKIFDGGRTAASADAGVAAPANSPAHACGLARPQAPPFRYVEKDSKKFLELHAGDRVRTMELGSGGPRAPRVRSLGPDVLEVAVGKKPFLVKLTPSNLNSLADMMGYLSDPDASLTNLMLRGDMGTGKNTLVYTLAGLLNQGVRVMSFHAHTNEKDLRYRTTLGEEKAGETSRKHSELYEGAQAGDWVILDEPNKTLQIGILNSLNTLLQDREETLPGEEQPVMGHSRFRAIALVNPPNRSYTVQEMPADFIRRFNVLDVDYMPFADEVDFVMDTVFRDEMEAKKEQIRPFIEQLVHLADDLRSSYRQGALPRPLSTRGVLNMAWHVKKFPKDLPYFREIFDPVYPTEYLEANERELVDEYLKHHGLQGQARPAAFRLPDIEIDEKAGKVRLGNEQWGIVELPLGDLKAEEVPAGYRDIPHLQANLYFWWAMMKDRALGRHSLVLGETGTGKTNLTGHFLYALLRMRPEPQTFTLQTRGQDIVGKPELKNDATYWPPYPLERAVARDTVWLVDEVTKPEDPGTVSLLNNVLQFGQILLPSGKVLNAGDGFGVVAMGTPARAQYESQEFSGEVLDRFSTHILKPLPREDEIGLVESYAEKHGLSVERPVLEALQKALDSLRQSYRDGLLPVPPSVQSLFRVVSQLGRFPEAKANLVSVFLSAFPAWEKSHENIIREALAPVAQALGLSPAEAGARAVDSSAPVFVGDAADALDETKVGIAGRFISIAPGQFEMGSPDDEAGHDSNEVLHTVELTQGFEMQAGPVTQRQYALVTHRNPAHFKENEYADSDNMFVSAGIDWQVNADHPVEMVSWFDAVEFANALSAANGLKPAYIVNVKRRSADGSIEAADVEVNEPNKNIYETEGYRLPTEAEWEYAARGGTDTPYWFDAAEINDHAWHGGNSGGRTHAVGDKTANPWGLHDMHGNVWEWVQDWYGDYQTTKVTDPSGPDAGLNRVVRGGAWSVNAWTLRSAYRSTNGSRADYVGFRLVRSTPNPMDETKVGIAGRFISIAPGQFEMGSPVGEEDHRSDEVLHTVELTQGVEMQAGPVTQRQYVLVMGSNPSIFKEQKHSDGDHMMLSGHEVNADHPVENVSWDDAQEFIKRLNAMQSEYTYRLPTEAEWEYAARAGTNTPYPFDKTRLDGHAWHNENSRGRTHAVGDKTANPWGLHDMLGNVWEWVQDWYGQYPDPGVLSDKKVATDPAGAGPGSHKVIRGGSWNDVAGGHLRSAYRGLDVPCACHAILGFRLARVKRQLNP